MSMLYWLYIYIHNMHIATNNAIVFVLESTLHAYTVKDPMKIP